MRLSVTAVVSLCAFSVGCTKKSSTVPRAPTPQVASPTSTAEPPAPTAPPPEARVGVSEDVARACRLSFGSEERAPKFAYDAEELLPIDRDVLQQVATCLTTGPLRGKAVQLVGRSDPRGTDEYNLGLGSRRARAVSDYLARLGVPSAQLATTTRGEIDARGRDELGWQADRRVDLELRQ